MTNRATVVQQLKKERDQSQKRVEQLDPLWPYVDFLYRRRCDRASGSGPGI
jgi:hypothetical protein